MIASQFSLPITFDLFFCLCSIHIDLSAQFKQRIKHESLLNRCYQYKHTFTISNAKTIFFCLFWAGCIVRLIETLKTQFSIILETRQLFFSFLFFFRVCRDLQPLEVVKVGGVPPVSPPTPMANLLPLHMWQPHGISISQVGAKSLVLYSYLFFSSVLSSVQY